MTIRRLVLIAASWMALSTVSMGAMAATGSPTMTFGPVQQGERAGTKQNSDSARYAERERKAPGLERFRGGDGVSIYIGGSVVAVALVVIIVLLIL